MARNWAAVKSIVPRSIARRMRSGMLVGPGFMKKCQPCAMFLTSRHARAPAAGAAENRSIIAGSGKTIGRVGMVRRQPGPGGPPDGGHRRAFPGNLLHKKK